MRIERRRRRCNDLLETNRVLEQLNLSDQRDRGLQPVPLDQIVGSSGRAGDFDLGFNPRRSKGERWSSIARASSNGVALPPVLLLKVGDAYFVTDGNHRVSVARANGQDTIEGRVIELDASPLRPEPKCERLGLAIRDKKLA